MRHEQTTIPKAETLMQVYTYVLNNRRRYSLLKLPEGYTILKESISPGSEDTASRFTPDGTFTTKNLTMGCTWKYTLREWNTLVKSYPILKWSSITPAKFSKHDGTQWQWVPSEIDLLRDCKDVTINPKNTPLILEKAKALGEFGWFAWQKQFANRPNITSMEF